MLKDIGQGADVILVRMGEHNGFELVAAFQQVTYIRDDQIDSQKIGARKHQSAVNGDGGIAVFDQHHVEAELS